MRSSGARETTISSKPIQHAWLLAVLVGLCATTLGCDEPSGSVSDPADAVVRVRADGIFLPAGERTRRSESVGSGFLIDEDGTIVTAHHVVAGATRVVVSTPDGRDALDAEVLASSECLDLALVRARSDAPDASVLSLATGTRSEIGDEVRAFDGSDEPSATAGAIIAAEPGSLPLSGPVVVIEHTAPIRVGASGGPLVHDGVAVGVNVALDDERSFAVSAQHVQDLREGGSRAPSLGLNAVSLPAGESAERGVRVVAVVPGSPADRAGILPGDVIQRVDGDSLRSDDSLSRYCAAIAGADGQPITIDVVRPSSGTFFSAVVVAAPWSPTAAD